MGHRHVHHALNLKTLGKSSHALGPLNEPWQVKLNDPASSVMSDFRDRVFFKVSAEELIDEALKKMKHAGLRAAFVVDDSSGELQGMITAYDILGEKPLRYLQSAGFADHKDVQVSDIMESIADVVVVDMQEVEQATVQSVLDALQKSGRTHLPVVESNEKKEPRLRGLFSLAKVLRLTEDERKSLTQDKA